MPYDFYVFGEESGCFDCDAFRNLLLGLIKLCFNFSLLLVKFCSNCTGEPSKLFHSVFSSYEYCNNECHDQ